MKRKILLLMCVIGVVLSACSAESLSAPNVEYTKEEAYEKANSIEGTWKRSGGLPAKGAKMVFSVDTKKVVINVDVTNLPVDMIEYTEEDGYVDKLIERTGLKAKNINYYKYFVKFPSEKIDGYGTELTFTSNKKISKIYVDGVYYKKK